MMGLAIMAARLAAVRTTPMAHSPFGGMAVGFEGRTFLPTSRKDCDWCEQRIQPGDPPLTSSEYYRIIDRLSRGESP